MIRDLFDQLTTNRPAPLPSFPTREDEELELQEATDQINTERGEAYSTA